MSSFDDLLHPRGQAANPGQFRAKTNDPPARALESGAPVEPPATPCTECGAPAKYRYGNVPRGYRSPGAESAFCSVHAARVAADGNTIEDLPKPQEPGEMVVWLIEGDDHEFERVEAVSEDDALDEAADRFRDRYDDDDDDDDDPRDSLSVAGVFRGEVDGYSDELEFVPHGDIAENDAYNKLDESS